MPDNIDEFEAEGFGHTEPHEKPEGGLRKNLAEAWRTQPLFKLMVIMIVVGIAIAGALGVFSGPSSSDTSKLVRTPDINEPPGGKASPYFIQQNRLANEERADQAMREGGSALPTPVGQNFDIGDLSGGKKEDPLAEFRAETERLKREMEQERQQNQQQIQMMQQIQQRPQEKEDDSLAQAMQRQMQELMQAWTPRNMKVVEGQGMKEKETSNEKQTQTKTELSSQIQQPASPALSQIAREKNLVQAGTVSYGQLLTEANSDIQSPILAQVLSGPMSGGRAVGRFRVMNDYLVLEFNVINFKGKDYNVNVLALDPNTTLGGMATYVDHRYLDRVLLPAAAAFASQFGSVLGQGGQTVTVTDNTVIVDQAKKSYKEAMFQGLGQAGQTIGQFLQQEASQIRPLIRVDVGTPLGLFFLSSVKEDPEQNNLIAASQNPFLQQAISGSSGYGQYGIGGYQAIPGYSGTGYGTASQTGYPYNSYQTPYQGGSTGYTGYGSYTPYRATGYYPGVQPIPGSGVTVISPNQTGLGTGY